MTNISTELVLLGQPSHSAEAPLLVHLGTETSNTQCVMVAGAFKANTL